MKISFDFEGTLADEINGEINTQKDEVIEKIKDHLDLGHEVFIVTKRYSPENSSKGSVNEHIDPLRLAAELRISGKNVIFTNRESKLQKVKELGVDHYFTGNNSTTEA